jgi:hypothetical protein
MLPQILRLPNNSMEPTWPAGSRCQLPLIDTGLAAGLVLSRGHGARVGGFCPSCPARAGQAAHLEAVRRHHTWCARISQ